MNEVAAWLATDEGIKWARSTFSDDASDSHDWIELRDDTDDDEILDHVYVADRRAFDMVRMIPVWDDLTWTPDSPP